MGSVYEATHELLGTRVAIKILHSELVRRTGLIDRFLQEARVAAQIKSAHVVHVTDVDRTPEGSAFIVMELLEGEPLSSTLDRQAKLPIATASDFVVQILDALEAAHALGVTHRDLKPENVFVTYQGAKPVLKLIDFGIAKLRTNAPGERSLTVAGMLMGTAEYMAPEQAYSADKVDARSDLYAVGVMLYEMIAGKRPVSGADARVIAAKVERGDVTPLVHAVPDVPREIAGLVHRAMAARPELRFASATEMRLALEAAIAGKRSATAAIAAPTPAPSKFATMQTAPVQAAFATPAGATPATDAAPRTERAGPIGYPATTPGPQMSPSAVTPPPGRSRQRSGGKGKWALVLIPLLAGAGGVVAWVVTTQNSPPAAPLPAPTTPPTWTAPSSAAAPTPPASISAPPVATLLPSPQTPSPSPRPGARPPRAAGSASASASGGAGEVPYTPPPFEIPGGFGFPTASDGGPTLLPFPVPSGFPTTLPSALPFPFPLPGVPGAPTAVPSGAKSI
jgi:serine/threonine protein kinase